MNIYRLLGQSSFPNIIKSLDPLILRPIICQIFGRSCGNNSGCLEYILDFGSSKPLDWWALFSSETLIRGFGALRLPKSLVGFLPCEDFSNQLGRQCPDGGHIILDETSLDTNWFLSSPTDKFTIFKATDNNSFLLSWTVSLHHLEKPQKISICVLICEV